MTVPKATIVLICLVCSFALLWDGFTTLYGTQKIFGATNIALIASILLGLLIIVIMVFTPVLLTSEELPITVKVVLVPLYPTAVVYDFYTSYIGNLDLLFKGVVDGSQRFVVIGLTIFVSSSSIILSLLLAGLRKK